VTHPGLQTRRICIPEFLDADDEDKSDSPIGGPFDPSGRAGKRAKVREAIIWPFAYLPSREPLYKEVDGYANCFFVSQHHPQHMII
jgi:hypothetical protein